MATHLTDEEIALQAKMRPIGEIADKLGLKEEDLHRYGRHKAKIDLKAMDGRPSKHGKIILVTAISPTPVGEGKTTVTIGLGDALRRLGKDAMVAMREPSLGPVFGVKGGAAGGGYAQVLPMEDINLHFTGDLHAITSANNLLAAMIDNHIFQGNELDIDPNEITFRRCLDINDRMLRTITTGQDPTCKGKSWSAGFDITAASETMATFCMAADPQDLKRRLGDILIAFDSKGEPLYAKQIQAQGAMAALLRDALSPNLVQTIEGTPALVHGGPFANIAHGCNSIIATKMATHLADWVVTEAGFGADLGAEKFLDIKTRHLENPPAAVVIVATIRALKYNGGVPKTDVSKPNVEALKKGIPNLLRHIDNMRNVFGLNVVVALNRVTSDTDEEIACLTEEVAKVGCELALTEVWAKGGEGGLKLAEAVLRAAEKTSNFKYVYDLNEPLKDKIEKIATRIYRAKGVEYTDVALHKLDFLEKRNLGGKPVCLAKTQYSFTDDPKLLGAPEDFTIHVKDILLSSGADFVVALLGSILKLPGLPKEPGALKIDVDENNKIHGLF